MTTNRYAVIMSGGRGERFWPLSTIKRPKQFLSLIGGKTMLIVSHDMQTIQAISKRILFFNAGKVLGHGAPGSVVGQYEAHPQSAHAGMMRHEWGTREALITQVSFAGSDGLPKGEFKWDEPVQVSIGYNAPHRIEQPVFGFSLADQTGHPVYGNNTQNESVTIPFIEGEGTIRLRFPRLPFPSGTFLFSASLHSSNHKTHFHHVDNGYPIQIVAPFWFVGSYLPIQWEIPS